MKKKVLLIFLAMVLVVPLAGFAACEGEEAPTDVSEFEERIDKLEADIDKLEADKKALAAEIAELKAPAEVIEWRMSTFMPASGDAWEKYYLTFAERVKEASNGRLVITMYGAGEIIPVMEMWEAVSKGVVDCCWSFGTYWTGKTPMSSFSAGLPLTAVNHRDAFAILYYQGVFDLIQRAYAKHNIHLLHVSPTQDTCITTKFLVNSVDDFVGKKVRAGGIEAEIATELGMSATYFPVPEVYGALESGVVDGVIMGGIIAARVFSFCEVADYIVQPTFNVSGEEILINLDAWNELPDDLKQILISVAHDCNMDRHGYSICQDAVDLAWMQENYGIQVQELPPEEMAKMRAAAMRVYDRYAAESPEFAEALAIIKDYMRLRGLLD